MQPESQEDNDDDFEDLLKLQEIFVLKEIKSELESRDLNEHGLA